MALFAFNLTSESSCPVTLSNPEAYSAEFGEYRAFEEALTDMVGIVEAMAAFDITSLEVAHNAKQQGVTVESMMPLYEGTFKEKAGEILKNIKTFLGNLWAKIVEFFKGAVAATKSLFMSGKKFADKYKDALNKKKTMSFKVKAYVYDEGALNDSIIVNYDVVDKLKKLATEVKTGDVAKLKEKMADFKDEKNSLLNKTRAGLCGQSGEVSEKMYGDYLFKFYRKDNGQKKEQEISVEKAMKVLDKDYTKVATDAAKKANDLFKKAMDNIKEIESDIKKIEDDKDRLEVGLSIAREYSNLAYAINKTYVKAFGAWKSAASGYVNLCKQICVRAIGKVGAKDA